MKNDFLYYLGFSHFLGIGPIRFSLLKKNFGSAKNAYLAKESELKDILGEKLTEKFISFRNAFDLEKKFDEIKKKDIKILTVDDDGYPSLLKNISDPPICLYIKGNFDFSSLDKLFSIAIVGTRKPTNYGIQIAKKFSFELAKAGFIIISGLAYGIDTIAHQSALEAQGKTIAVLGCGVDIIYPSANKNLYEKIIEKNGAVISEFPPGQTVLKGLFVSRNRIISGLSKGVIVVEGTADSGSLITGRYAGEQGKEVFAPPSPITSELSQAPNILLKQGAKLITSVEDIFEEFNLKITPKKQEEIEKNFSEIEKNIFQALKEKPLAVDDLVLKLNLSINEVLKNLSIMEIKNLVKKNNQGLYEINTF
ncbi:MAG: DNA-processing protein DprA [Patescibacteria group bacterium]|nr:DNA-processing protein DprA [Patescibacteria group bacterium]